MRGNLATFLRAAGSGRRIVVTVDGKPIAQLSAIESDDLDLSFRALAERGEITLATDPSRSDPGTPVPLWPGARLDRLVREVRGR